MFGLFFTTVTLGLFFTTVTLGLDPGVSSLSSSGAFFFIVILGRNASRGSPLQIPVCKFPTTLGPFRPVGLELRL